MNDVRDLGIASGGTIAVAPAARAAARLRQPPCRLSQEPAMTAPTLALPALGRAGAAAAAAGPRRLHHARSRSSALALLARAHRAAAALGAAVEEPSRTGDGSLRRPRQLRQLLRQPGAGAPRSATASVIAVAQHGDLRAARLRLCLWADAHLHAGARPVPDHRPDPAPGAVAPAGDQPRLPVRQSGPGQGPAVRRLDLRPDRHRHRRGVLDLPACADHHHDRARRSADARLYEAAAGAARQSAGGSSGR